MRVNHWTLIARISAEDVLWSRGLHPGHPDVRGQDLHGHDRLRCQSLRHRLGLRQVSIHKPMNSDADTFYWNFYSYNFTWRIITEWFLWDCAYWPNQLTSLGQVRLVWECSYSVNNHQIWYKILQIRIILGQISWIFTQNSAYSLNSMNFSLANNNSVLKGLKF